MKKVVDNNRLMLKICDLFYNQNLSQQMIAAQLQLSRPTIAKFLEKAKTEGVVKVIIEDVIGMKYVDLEWRLEEKYGLKEVIIIDKKIDENEQKDEIAKAAAQYLERIIKTGDRVGVSMGTTVSRVAKYIAGGASRNIQFLPLIGGIGQMGIEFHANYIVECLAKAFKSQHILMHAPARVSEKQIKESLVREHYIKEIFDLSHELNVAIVSMGVPVEGSTVMKTGYYPERDIEEMWKRGVAGDICMNFYDINGDTQPFSDFNDSVVGIDIHDLRGVPQSIGLASGIKKVSAIVGAINGGYINVLVTDVDCAQKLLTFEEEIK